MKNYVDGNLCDCCFILLANGEHCEPCDHSKYPLMAHLEGEDVTPNCEDDCGVSFEWGVCDGCGEHIGGTLHRVAVWYEEEEE